MTIYFDYQPNSITVLQGKVFDIANVYGCNMVCPYCQTPQFIKESVTEMGLEELFNKLSSRSKQIDGILFSGGEPTAYPELIPLIQRISETLSLKIVIETNALEPTFIEAVAPFISTLKIDLKSTPEHYEALQSPYDEKTVHNNLLRIKEIAEEGSFCTEYHTTMYPPLIGSYEVLYQIASYIPLASSWYLHQYYPQENLESAAIDSFSQSKLEHMMKALRIDLSREAIYLRNFLL
ncbi:radical SAM protein [bacterium]|nr:radical SAM protein [bacterium]